MYCSSRKVVIARAAPAGAYKQAAVDQFRFGREADGTPTAPWGWEDLDLRHGSPAHGRQHRNRRDELNNTTRTIQVNSSTPS
jgi:hypothetical protein